MARSNGKENTDPRDQFFPGQRRQVQLERWIPKRNAENEKRVQFKFKMTITGDSFAGFPDFLLEGYHAVEKERSGGTYTSDQVLEAMALEYFETPKGKECIQRAVGVTVQGLKLSREKEGDSYVTVLRYHYHVPWFRGIWKFIDKFWGMTLFCDFTPSPDFVPDQGEDAGKQMRLGDKEAEA